MRDYAEIFSFFVFFRCLRRDHVNKFLVSMVRTKNVIAAVIFAHLLHGCFAIINAFSFFCRYSTTIRGAITVPGIADGRGSGFAVGDSRLFQEKGRSRIGLFAKFGEISETSIGQA